MGKLLKIGIVGCGAIGSSLAKFIAKELKGRAILAALYDLDIVKAKKLSRAISQDKNLAVDSLAELMHKSQLVIECASSSSSAEIAKKVLSKGRQIMVMSVGGIVSHFPQLCKIADRQRSKIYLPSGAICGIDALKAAKIGRISKVVLTTRKNPLSFKGVKYLEQKGLNLANIKQDRVLFSGPAETAVKYFPQNINVAAVLSLSGIGPRKTWVKIIASPKSKRNIHEIQIESSAGIIFTRTENVLHPDNPKTSYLAVLSAAATLKQILEPVKIGT